MMNVMETTCSSLIRQFLFIAPRIMLFVYEILYTITAGKHERRLQLTLFILAMIANVINIAMIVKE